MRAVLLNKPWMADILWAGSTKSTNGDVTNSKGKFDYWVFKLSSKGTIVWQKTLGGKGGDFATSIQQAKDGGYIVVGYTSATSRHIGKRNDDVTGFHGKMDYWLVKLTSNGEIAWQKCLGGTENDIASSVQQTSDGGYVIVGISNSKDGDLRDNKEKDDIWVVKLLPSKKK
ncbi:MAG: hypothetical protein ACI8YQ_004571 [Polaribacter sp.]|jgi:hypothetical protein